MKTTRIPARATVLAAWTTALSLATGCGLAAQGPPGGRDGFDRSQIERRIMAHFEETVRTELGLDSATAVSLFGAVEDLAGERRALQMREMRLTRQLRGTGVYISEEQSREALEEFIAIKREEVRLLEAEQARLSTVLTPPQLLRFYTLREGLGERIRRMRRGGEGSQGNDRGPIRLP